MAIKSVDLTTLPKRTRSLSAEDRATADALLAAMQNGKAATDGEARERAKTLNSVSLHKRLMIRAGIVPAGMEVKTRILPVPDKADMFTWTLHLGPAPAEPRKRPRKNGTNGATAKSKAK